MSLRSVVIVAVLVVVPAIGCSPNAQQTAATGSSGTVGLSLGGFSEEQRREMDEEQAAPKTSFQPTPISAVIVEQYSENRDEVAEAREWLADEANHRLAEPDCPRDTAQRLVEDLYGAGASKVFVVGITKSDAIAKASELHIVVDPLDVEKRQKVIQVGNDFYLSYLAKIGKTDLVEANRLIDTGQTIIPLKLAF